METITISRSEYDAQKEQIADLTQKVDWLMEQLRLLRKKQFGTSSEQSKEQLDGQLSLLFNEAEAYAAPLGPQKTTQVAAHTRKQSGSVKDVVPDNIPVEVVKHRLSEEERVCPQCGELMQEIGTEARETLKLIPAKAMLRRDVYYTYACENCEKNDISTPIVKAPKEPSVIPGSFASAQAIAHIMTQKFVMASPLYRQEQEWARQGLKLSRQTMSNWVLRAAEDYLLPVYEELHRQLVKCEVLHADETTLQVLHEPGKKAQTKSYMWLYRTGRDDEPPIVLYEYQPSRKAEHAAKFLDGFSGFLHADGYQGYHKLPGIQPRAQRSGSRLERRSKGAGVVFAAGGNEAERTLRRRAGLTPGGSSTRRSAPCQPISGRARRRLPDWNIAISCSPGRSSSKNSLQKSGQSSV